LVLISMSHYTRQNASALSVRPFFYFTLHQGVIKLD